MDSPESSKPVNTNCETATPQDSPAFLYMSNLSPLPPVKAPSFAPGFQGLVSPPPVFTSPKPNPCSQLAFLKSKQVSTPSVAELPGSDGDGKNTRLENGSDSDIPVDDLIKTPTESPHQSLLDIASVASVDPNFSFNSTIEKSEYSDQPPDAASEEILVKPESKDNTTISEDIVVVPPVIAVQTEENIAAGKATSLDGCSHLSLRTIKVGNENENFLNFTEAALTEPFQEKVQNHPEAFQYCGLQRRLQFDDAEHEVISNQPAPNPPDIEGPESLSVEMPEMLINSKLDEVFQPMSYPRNSSNTTKIPNSSGDERNYTEKYGGASEEFNIPRSGIERTNSLDSSCGDCFTRCNCKKTKCLKLYCDCFAAAMYCAELCSCGECFNRPEHEDEVCEAREKIECRDPLAFVPKVVQDTIAQSGSSCRGDGTSFTPASSRHRRGCRCRKSMCLKKYCECFEAYVGCSDKCLCVGCKNSFGRRRETGEQSSLSGGPNPHGWVDSSKAQLFSSGSSLGWHSSSVIPMAQFGKTKVLRDLKFDGELSNILHTPEKLKNTSTPLNAVKVSSPKKKRVSPSHAPHGFGSSSSAGRRSRVLVSPFPPLASCADSKTVVDEQAKCPQKQSNNKRDQNL